MATTNPIDRHLAKFSGDQLESLRHLRAVLRETLPTATEAIKYGMPAFVVDGSTIAGFDGFKDHCSYFPHSGNVVDKIERVPGWCEAERGTLRFPIGKKLPKYLIRDLVRIRQREIAAKRSSR